MWLAQKYPEHFIKTVDENDFDTDDYKPVLGDNSNAYIFTSQNEMNSLSVLKS